MSRVDELRAQMEAAVAEAEAQEAYEALTEQFRANPSPELGEQRKRAAEALQATRAALRADRGPVSFGDGVVISPESIVATTTVKEN